MIIFLEVPNFGKQLMPYSGKFPRGPVFVIFAKNLLTLKIKLVKHNMQTLSHASVKIKLAKW